MEGLSPASVDSFDRLFPRRELFRGKALASILWSFLDTCCLVLALFVIFLVVDLLETSGELVISAHQPTQTLAENKATAETEWAELEPIIGPENFAALAPRVSTGETEYRMTLDNTGVLPTVWKSRHHWWGGLIANAYRMLPSLRSNRPALAALVFIGICLGLVRTLFATLARRARSDAALQVAVRLRQMIHRQRLRLGPGDLTDSEAQSVRDIFMNDTEVVRRGIYDWIGRFGRYPLTLALLFLLAMSIHWRLTLQCIIPLAFGWYLLQRQRFSTQQKARYADSQSEEQLRILADGLDKTRLIRGYGMDEFESAQFQHNLERYRASTSQISRSERGSQWISRFIVILVVSVVLIILGLKVLEPAGTPYGLSLSATLVLMTIFAWMYRPLEELFHAVRARRDVATIADRIYRYLDRVPTVGQAVGAKFLQPLSKRIHFENVSYTLKNRGRLLNQLELKIPAGNSVALVSHDPLVPKALAYLLPRFIEPNENGGRVLFDGQDIAWVTLESLRAETVYVSGSDPLMTGTVRENIACGRSDHSLQDVMAAAKQVHASKFILDLPQGYETMLGEHGEQLDPGQSFRLGLARAMLRDPALLIIEEPVAQLDEDTKALLDDAYNRIFRDRTVILLPSRLSSVKRADRVVLLHNGRVDSIGPHAELASTSQLYRHWEYLRFSAMSKEVTSR
ncbi:ABC transporter transmembrane domain-containing protein [Thalassoroseus pseudoceratinae]|uniref:ABC transporter transmembrane domain-containing protein n=1 Tax=Thalassoroseus pseudoceratinae TaxID=2713176 RepID=UPI00142451C5|nr:ABC transporter ATP-binding protein [Thalassoroseus pseudoceratinae]